MMLRLSVLMLVLAAAVPLGDAFVVHNAGSMLRSFNGQGAAACSTRTPRNMQLRMGLFDGIGNAFKNAMANEELETPPPDGLSQDPWLNGMRKNIILQFVRDGEVVATAEVLPGDKLVDAAKKAQVTLGDTVSFTANEKTGEVTTKTFRMPAPERRNVIADEALLNGDELMDTGISAPVFTNYASRGEVRTVKVTDTVYVATLPSV
mmetsp:Transcript_6324/g.14852  ORF Transcript_6324/g.14852 Transcript_6324/m.14852 type:complete len:206 (-) Transcript_6324:168-785(-)